MTPWEPTYCVECGCTEPVHVTEVLTRFADYEIGGEVSRELPVVWCVRCEQWCSGTFDDDDSGWTPY